MAENDKLNSLYPNVLSLNSKDLIEWCNARKKEMHLSNAKLASLSNVPEGTIDRILTGKNLEFRYSTIQPLVKLLLGYYVETPINESNDYYVNTIDGYKMAIENKDHIIDELKRSYEMLSNEKDYLKKSNEDKQKLLDKLTEHITWLETQVDKKKKS